MSFYTTSNVAGINLTDTTNTTPTPVALGTIVSGTNGSQWEYVFAGSGISQYMTVLINGSGTAYPSTTALAVSMKKVGFAQSAISSGYYGWVARSGYGLTTSLLASCAAGAQLYTTSTAGSLDDAVVTAGLIPGALCIVAASGGGATNTTITAGQPTVVIQAAPGS